MILIIEKVYNFIKQNPDANYDMIAAGTDIKRESIPIPCATLVSKGFVEKRKAGKKDTRFRVIKDFEDTRRNKSEDYGKIRFHDYTATLLKECFLLFYNNDKKFDFDSVSKEMDIIKSTSTRLVNVLRYYGLIDIERKDWKNIFLIKIKGKDITKKVPIHNGTLIFKINKDGSHSIEEVRNEQ